MPVRCFISLLLGTFLFLAGPPGAEAGVVRISGSGAVSGPLKERKPEIESKTGAELEITENNSRQGLADLVEGACDIAMISAPLAVVVAGLDKEKAKAADGADLVAHSVGGNDLAFIVHPSNPVKDLTLDQIAEVLSGRVTNWKDLGGEDMKIDVVVTRSDHSVRTTVEEELLDGNSIAGTPRELKNLHQIPRVVSAVRGAFGLTMSSAVGKGVSAIETDDTISQRLFFVTLGSPRPDIAEIVKASRGLGIN